MLEPGDQAPDFTLPDQDGTSVTLSELRGGPVVVYFYPKDGHAQVALGGAPTHGRRALMGMAAPQTGGVLLLRRLPEHPVIVRPIEDKMPFAERGESVLHGRREARRWLSAAGRSRQPTVG